MKHRRLSLALALILPTVGSLSGCSWIFVQPLPDKHVPGDYANCTTNPAAPIFDTLFTLTNLGSAVYEAGQNNVQNKGTVVTTGALLATMWFSSALYGYMKTSDCRDAEDAYYDRPRRLLRPSAPPARYPQWAPAAAPSVTVPSSPGQQEDDDEPRERRPPPEPADGPRAPTKGQPLNPNTPSSGA